MRLPPTNGRMEDPPAPTSDGGSAGEQELSSGLTPGETLDEDNAERPAPAEAFQTLANETRVAVLITLLTSERTGDGPTPFSELQQAAGSGSSAGFAYHLRQLNGHFIRREADGYVLTPAGRRAAEAIVSGTFTDPSRAS